MEERERDQRRERPVDDDGTQATAEPPDRPRARLREAEPLPRVTAGGEVAEAGGWGVLRHPSSLPAGPGVPPVRSARGQRTA